MNSNTATVSIAVNPVNDGPINRVPGAQITPTNGSLVFSSATGNAIGPTDVDAGNAAVQVTLTVHNGTLTLNGIKVSVFTVALGPTSNTSQLFELQIVGLRDAAGHRLVSGSIRLLSR